MKTAWVVFGSHNARTLSGRVALQSLSETKLWVSLTLPSSPPFSPKPLFLSKTKLFVLYLRLILCYLVCNESKVLDLLCVYQLTSMDRKNDYKISSTVFVAVSIEIQPVVFFVQILSKKITRYFHLFWEVEKSRSDKNCVVAIGWSLCFWVTSLLVLKSM